jgi:hypothetical protein
MIKSGLAALYQESQKLNAVVIPAIRDMPNTNSAKGNPFKIERFAARFAPGLANTTKRGWE